MERGEERPRRWEEEADERALGGRACAEAGEVGPLGSDLMPPSLAEAAGDEVSGREAARPAVRAAEMV